MGSARALLRDGVVFASGAALAFLLGASESRSVDAEQVLGVPDVAAGRSWGQHAPKRKDAAKESRAEHPERGGVRANVATDFNAEVDTPRVAGTAYVDRLASVIGNVELGERVFVAPLASVRGDEGQPIHVGAHSNVQDGVVIHGLETEHAGAPNAQNTYEVDGQAWSVYVGERVSLAHQSQVHGPAWVEDDAFVGMQALVFKARVGKGCVIEPAAKVIGVNIPPGRYVPAGAVIATQAAADALPEITFSYGLKDLNEGVVHVNTSLADAYSGREAPAAAAHE